VEYLAPDQVGRSSLSEYGGLSGVEDGSISSNVVMMWQRIADGKHCWAGRGCASMLRINSAIEVLRVIAIKRKAWKISVSMASELVLPSRWINGWVRI
jgi:hypothetical protein